MENPAIKNTHIGIRITETMAKDIKQQASTSARFPSEVIRDALRWYLSIQQRPV